MAKFISEEEKRRLQKLESTRTESVKEDEQPGLLDRPIKLGEGGGVGSGIGKLFRLLKKKEEDDEESDEEVQHKKQQGERVW